jgi:hypothetical protein
MSEHNDQVFEVVITHYDKVENIKTIVWGPTALLARSEETAKMCAVRQVDDKYDCNDLKVLARPFT